MNKLELLNSKLVDARKSNDVVTRNILTTFKAEYELLQKTDPKHGIVLSAGAGLLPKEILDNVFLEGLAKSLIKRIDITLKVMPSSDERHNILLREKEVLIAFLPVLMSELEIREYINNQDDKSIGNIMKSLAGKADGKLVKEILSTYQ